VIKVVIIYLFRLKPELVQAIKKGAESILQGGGIIRSFENLGYKQLPYRIKRKDGYHLNGKYGYCFIYFIIVQNLIRDFLFNFSYILIKFYSPAKVAPQIHDEINKDSNFIKATMAPFRDEEEEKKANECECKKHGQFVKDKVDYMKPLTVWNKRSIYKDYGMRL
jgi:ribosomal protein S6